MNLSGNTILVTGGASGIGLALAVRFAKVGSKVIICGRRSEALAMAKKAHPELLTVQADVSTEAGRENLFNHVSREFSQVNVLVNNAGIQNRPPPILDDRNWAPHRQEIATNIEAPMHLTMLFAPFLLKQKNPVIINVSSGLAFAPISILPTYCMTKAALHSYTMSLRHQVKSTPLQIVELIPPAVNTDLGGKGLHTHGVDLDKFADHCMVKLAAGELEFGYESSETRRLAVKQAVDPLFHMMNK